MRGGGGVARALLLAVAVAALLLSAAVGAEDDAALPRRRSLHQPFFPIDYSPPPPASDGSPVLPSPPPPAASEAAKGGGRSGSSLTNAIAIALATGLVTLAVAGYSCFLLLRRRSDADGLPKSARAVDARVASDIGSRHRSPPPSSTASDAIYIDPVTTMVVERPGRGSPDLRPLALVKPPSPDLRPLPPLKRHAQQPPPPPASTPPMTGTGDSSDEDDRDTFYTARRTAMSSISRSTSQRSTMEQPVHQSPAPVSAPTPTPPPAQANSLRPPRPPPPPPPPRQRLLRPMPAESPPPPALANLALTNSSEPSVQDRGGENPNSHSDDAQQQKPPSLKPLHWDKLRAISGRTTVWDQVNNSDSFRVDEAAMESLFTNKAGGGAGNPGQAAARKGDAGGKQQESHRLLNPKRLQNVAIMLKALNVTSSDVIGALVHGNRDLGPEFFEALTKMAPTKEEELKLKDYSGDLLKLDLAERFLKDILGVPFAFKRVNAMLYRANFDTELNYLRKSFGTLEAACADLRNSKQFLKLLDAVLKTGNRMNDGTNRGEARAFRLDTLLKLADIKSTDGKTTVLHFVVQELIRSEGLGSNKTDGNPGGTSKEQFKKDGLKVLAGLSSELSNVKSAATLEMDTLISNVLRLETDLKKVKQVLELKETCPDQGSSDDFFEEMDAFLRRAQAEIESVKVAGEIALRHVKDTTEYFHGDATKEEPHHLRIFMVVSEFLATLDRVCRDVGRTPERVMMGSGKSFRVTTGTSLPPRPYEHRRELSSSDEDSSSS
ncbi:hypothetical protein QOZ80_7BG0606420 [Eleusine coracana subsp. coracana]|nr:hypothetical protein QOZ80_7BG0606420 [Eleusine coracana subsp. coracana]